MKKIAMLILLLMVLCGCSKSNNVDISESIQSESWVKLEQYASSTTGSGEQGDNDGIRYVRNDYKVKPLCLEENISSIEYFLIDGTGTFMDKNRTRGNSDNVKNEPYILSGNNQEEIYFSAYFIFENYNNLTNDQKVQLASKILEKQRIKISITYQDGSVKVRQIGIKVTSNYNYKYLDLYEITTP